MLATVVFLAALLTQEWVLDADLPARLNGTDLARGKLLYGAYCERCHGEHGDDTGYPYITPLGGLPLRLSDTRMRQFRGPTFHLRGRFYPADEARALMAYVLTLPGEKGFRRPENLMSAHLLNQKVWNRKYLVIDVRTEAEFRKAHIRGAVHLNPAEFGRLKHPALAPDYANRIVVVYDEGSSVRASKAWQSVFQSGHRLAAVLDGGFKKWEAQNFEISTAPSALTASPLFIDSGTGPPSLFAGPKSPFLELRVDWRKTTTDTGLRHAPELTEYFWSAGFKGPGPYRLKGGAEGTDLFVFQLHLLGFSVDRLGADEIVVR